MAILLLIVIYIAFIGLGIPDSLIGSAWPAIYQEFDLPVSYISCVTLLVSGCTVLSGMFSDRLINRLGTGKVTAISTALTAVALLGFSLSGHFAFMCLLAIPLGLGAGAIDAALNNYIALHYSASHMNYLHCFYGIGVSCSPYLMSLALSGNSWRSGYSYAFGIQLTITVILLLSLPMWKKSAPGSESEEAKGTVLKLGDMIKMPSVRMVWIIMLSTNAIEYACGTWGSTYMVNARGLTPETGAKVLALYYAGMALGRFFSGVISKKVYTWNRIWLGIGIVLVAVLLLVLPLPLAFATAGLFLIGLGNGSIYPNFIYLTPHHFGEEASQSIMGSQIATAYIGVMITPPLFGFISGLLGISVYPIFLLILFVIMTVSIWAFAKQMKASNKYDKTV